jgi:hypothetical protein
MVRVRTAEWGKSMLALNQCTDTHELQATSEPYTTQINGSLMMALYEPKRV